MTGTAFSATEYDAGGVRLRLVVPPSDLAPYLSAYYRTEIADGCVVEDWLPPEEANLRTGRAEIYQAAIGSDNLVRVPNAVISGPTDRATRLRIGPGTFWGIGLSPIGWARFIGSAASDAANQFRDIRQAPVDDSISALMERLRDGGDDTEAASGLIDQTFRGLLDRKSSAQDAIQKIHKSLLSGDIQTASDLASSAGMSTRTFERFCKRHFGFSARTLLNRQRFLRSLGKFMLDPTMKWISALDTHYWDQAHFIRDFRSIMGMTPGEYAARPHPIVKAAVAVTHKASGVAHQALYRPDDPTKDHAGL